MLSICIPVYNFDVTGLVVTLHQQAIRNNIAAEVICIDDCSGSEYRDINKDICNTYGRYIQLDENVGRARIRNLFLEYAAYNYLLFLDCDSVLITSNFVKEYIDTIIGNGAEVICGGRIYNEIKPSGQKLLRWKYGRKKESMPVEVRIKHPNASFITCNFVINKCTLSNCKFDERLVNYGHEDTLFGFQLKQNNIKIQHIENPILNGYLEDNEEFLGKTELGLDNLLGILQFLNNDRHFIEDVTILKIHRRIRRFRFDVLFVLLFSFIRPALRLNLAKGFSNLFWFDCYKLGYFSTAYLTRRKSVLK